MASTESARETAGVAALEVCPLRWEYCRLGWRSGYRDSDQAWVDPKLSVHGAQRVDDVTRLLADDRESWHLHIAVNVLGELGWEMVSSESEPSGDNRPPARIFWFKRPTA